MPNTSHLYYTDKKSEAEFSYIPQGTLDIDRVLKSKPYWKKPNLPTEAKRKTLFIADWTAYGWPEHKIQQVIDQLNALLAEGFDIYLCQENHTRKLYKDNLNFFTSYYEREEIKPVPVNDLFKQLMLEFRLNADQVHILDDYWLNYLLSEKSEFPSRTLDASNFFDSPHNQHAIMACLEQAQPKIDEVVFNKYDKESNNGTSQLVALFPDQRVIKKYTELQLEDTEIKQLFAEGKVIVKGEVLSLEDLKNVEYLILRSSRLPNALLQKLFAFTPNLSNLDLSCYYDTFSFEENINLPNLKRLKISTITINDNLIKKLLNNAPQLSEIDSDNIFFDNIATDLLCPNLKKIRLASSQDLTLEKLNQLIKNTPSIEQLDLTDSLKITDDYPIQFNLPNLNNLTFYNLSKANCQHILQNKTNLNSLTILSQPISCLNSLTANHLKHLHFSYINKDSNGISAQVYLNQIQHLHSLYLEYDSGNLSITGPLDLQELTELKLTRLEIDSQEFYNILQGVPNLKILTLKELWKCNDHLWGNLCLSELNHLTINDCNLPIPSLEQLLSHTSKLTFLDIQSSYLQGELQTQMNFPDLQQLKVNYCLASPKNLSVLLKNCPKLKVLEISFSPESDDLITLNKPLNALQDLKITHTKLSKANIENLLANAPNLKSLKIQNCTLTDLSLNDITLDNLETLEIIDADIDIRVLNRLLKAAPNLKVAELKRCNKLNDTTINRVNKRYASPPPLIKKSDLLYTAASQRVTKHNRTGKNTSGNQRYDAIPIGPNDEIQYDADTDPGEPRTFNLNRIFYPLDRKDSNPDPRLYRQGVTNSLLPTRSPCGIDEAFTLYNKGDINLIDCDSIASESEVIRLGKTLPKDPDFSYYYGKQSLTLTPQWQAISSLSAQEVLTHYHLDPGSDSVEIKYSKRDNLYYIRSTEGTQPVTLDFLLKVPKQQYNLPLDIQDLVADLRKYQAEKLELDEDREYTGHDYLQLIMKQKVGACRHRAMACQWKINQLVQQKKLPPEIKTRIVTSVSHAFVEIFYCGSWVPIDLGGYPAYINIFDPHKPTEQNENNELLQDSDEMIHEKASSPLLSQNYNQRQQQFINYFSPWQRETKKDEQSLAYYQRLVNGKQKNILVETQSQPQVQALNLALLKHCTAINRPVFCVNTPDDLVCSAPFMRREGDHGYLQKGPGGPLFDFLQAHHDPHNPPVIVINYDRFSADDIVRFNSIVDKVREVDGVKLPKETIVIGLQNMGNPDCYQGDDFYSRFGRPQHCPLTTEQLQAQLPNLPLSETSVAESYCIDLFHALDWQERLLGRWVIKGDSYYYEQGELEQALASGLPISIANGLWDNDQFRQFWQQAWVRGKIEHAGQTFVLPNNLKLIKQEGYNWQILVQRLEIKQDINPLAPIINPTRLGNLFNHYQCDNSQQSLMTLPGLIESHAGQTLPINLSRTLSIDEWAQILSACEQHKVKLQVNCAPGIILPDVLGSWPPCTNIHTEAGIGETSEKDSVIISTEPDTTVAQLLDKQDEWLVLDISECSPSDLLDHLKGELDNDALRLRFSHKQYAVLQALAAGKKVILKGKFSTELVDSLAHLYLKRQTDPNALGQLVLIPDDPSLFNWAKQLHHKVDIQEKQDCLNKLYSASELAVLTPNQWQQEPLSRLKARLNFYRLYPEKPTNANWQGLEGLPSTIRLGEFNATHATEIAQAFTQQRLDAVNDMLTHTPFVFLAGITAVGKSTFVEKKLIKDGSLLYQGESKLKEWASDQSNQRKILFIDEANIGKRQWSEFEGLFNQPPSILINGIVYPLTSQHKVIFAGNPLNYGGERVLSPLFARYGHAVVFEPLSLEFIYEEILKPVFANTDLEQTTLNAIQPILNVYRFLCEHAENEVLISPRELQMMALMVLNYHQKNPEQAIEQAALHYAYQLGVNLVPANLRNKFEQQFKPGSPLSHSSAKINKDSEFIITPSREGLCQQLDDLLDLRSLRRQWSIANEAQAYGGLGGIIYEGLPGVGKSEMVFDRLRAHGFHEVKLDSTIIPEQAFYRMPVSMQPSEKRALLLKAFDEGAMVIVDEINSSPMMERLLNDLLMGKTPEGKRPAKPGFTIIGTQNPVTMSGRRPPSTALARRLITTEVLPLPYQEVITVLMQKGLNHELANELVNAFETQRQFALSKNLSPTPTFRDLIHLSDNLLKHASAVIQEDYITLLEKTNISLEGAKKLLQSLCANYSPPQSARFFQPVLSSIEHEALQKVLTEKCNNSDSLEKLIETLQEHVPIRPNSELDKVLNFFKSQLDKQTILAQPEDLGFFAS